MAIEIKRNTEIIKIGLVHDMIVQHNMLAMNANNRYGKNIIAKSKSAEKLASGYRINRAADDAAGLEISSRLNKQVKGLNQGLMNAQDGISLCQVADGALSEATDMLQRMNELALQAANGTNSDSDREAIQMEIDQLKGELDRIGETTEFNEEKVFKGPEESSEVFSSVVELVKSPAAVEGLMTEAFRYENKEDPSLNGYYPSGSLDFSEVDVSNVQYLYDKTFEFHCSQGCEEAFRFTMIDGDGAQSSIKNLGRKDTHEYTIDIHGLTNGKEVVDKIYEFIKENPIYKEGNEHGVTEKFPDGVLVSHSNTIFKTEDSVLTISAHTGKGDLSTAGEQYAENYFRNKASRPNNQGEIECTILGEKPAVNKGKNTYVIQAGANSDEKVNIDIDYMNSDMLGLTEVNVTSEEFATYSLEAISNAIQIVIDSRNRIGAQQNRLEHSILNLGNISENTTAAYSKIKDTDMASEMVKFSNMNIVASANESIMAQANQMNEGVLSLLQ